MRISGLCLLIGFLCLCLAVDAGGSRRSQDASAMWMLLASAVLCLGVLELKIHRRSRFRQQRQASRLAEALRTGALR